MSTRILTWPQRHPLTAFFILSYVITWALAGLTAEGLLPLPPALRAACAILHRWGPALAAVAVAGLAAGRAGVGELLGRLRVWRVGWICWLFALLYPVASKLLAVAIGALLGETPPVFFSTPGFLEGSGAPALGVLVLAVPMFAGIFLQAGLAEEIGWRGFALPRLQARFGPLAASLILSVLWTFWHFHPLNLAFYAPIAGRFLLSVACTTIILTWLFNRAQGSVLLAAVYHTAGNFMDWVAPLQPGMPGAGGETMLLIQQAILLLTAVALAARGLAAGSAKAVVARSAGA